MKRKSINLMLLILLNVFICFNLISQTEPSGAEEKYRPQIHFTPFAHWMNDPNGMVYYAGEYHLFYQFYPGSTFWGPMHWGHAISKDLVHWQRLPIALYPDSLGWIFSGSAVMDLNNTSGLGTKDNPAMIAFFTYHNVKLERTGSNSFQNQGIAFSLDKGRTWNKYRYNPVLKNPGTRDFRDPKVFWYEKTKKWIVVLASGDRVKLYSSPNMVDWKFESDFGMNLGAHGGVWECPNLFPLKVENSKDTKWVLLVSINPGGPNGGSATQYFVGDFDGHQYKNTDTITRWIDYGKDDYAGVTWSGIPASDGRCIFIGWMSNWQYSDRVPTLSWRGANTIPRELSLLFEDHGYILASKPLSELANLRSVLVTPQVLRVKGEMDISSLIPIKKGSCGTTYAIQN